MQVKEKNVWMKKVNKAVLFLLTCSPTSKITITEVSRKVIKANIKWSFPLKNNSIYPYKNKSPVDHRTAAEAPTKLKKKTTV